ncbi:molybdopterin-containing oxidoreductase family protein [Candidatus Magnetomonas plexicatena]|uniref:molybdopterin-containing oxidoreductase family protein n=1 Tax=Candidatus Magnetomonas plexicatena TaxID=2552947 RepID=UPI001C75A015|nr:molybdopterin-dependent oxidoreductase [Nitrospirales bacterium LBB_01]
MLKKKLSRRTFLKTAGVAVAATSALSQQSCKKRPKQSSNKSEIKKIATQCQGCGANRCAIYVYVKNGRIWKVEGNPKSNYNLGSVCPRGHGYVHGLYDKYRIKQPLKRTENNTFVPISWEDAFKEIAMKLNLIIMDNGPQSVFWLQYPMANAALSFRFMHALGSPNTISHGSTCYVARNAAFNVTYGGLPSGDMKHSRYTIIVGRNPAAGIRLYHLHDLMYAKNNGAKIVVIDPRHSETAVIANDWLPVNPGTDLALLLGLMHVIIDENLYDKEFIENYTVGFDKLEEMIASYPPKWAEKVCDIPKELIYSIAREFAANKPHALVHRGYHGGYGAGYVNSFQTARAIAIINALAGNFEREGGLYMPLKPELGELKEGGHPSPEFPTAPKADGSGIPGRYPLGSYSDGISHAVPELAMSGDLSAGFIYHTNPLRTNPNPKRVMSGYKKLKLLVTIDTVMSETASISDYVLPESFFLERDDAVDTVHSLKTGQVSIVQQVVKPMYDTKPLLDILTGLSKWLGIEKYFAFTQDEANALRLKPFGITLDELKREGVMDVGTAWTEGFKPLKTKSEKIEIYSEKLASLNIDPLPHWIAPLTSPDPNDKHSFRLLHGKQAVQTNVMTFYIPELRELSLRADMIRLWINRSRAESLNIKDGDNVQIESDIGKGVMKVRVTEGLHPSCVWMPSGYGGFSKYLDNAYGVGLSYNDFLPTYFDPVVGHVMANEIIVRIKKV